MKKKVLALAVSGLLLASGPLYASESVVTRDLYLTDSQKAMVAEYKNSHSADYKVAIAKLVKDKKNLSEIVFAKKLDHEKLKSVLQTIAQDQVTIRMDMAEFANYIYNNVATQAQKVKISSNFEEKLMATHGRPHEQNS